MRERLMKANGRADKRIVLHEDLRCGLYSNASLLLQRAIVPMDRWTTAIEADTRAMPRIEKIVQSRKADLVEGCMTRDPRRIFVRQKFERYPATSCEALHPSNSFPREAARASVAADVVKCQLRAPQRRDDTAAFTDAQWARLKAAFPQGVCDWTQPGVEQQGLAGTWQRFRCKSAVWTRPGSGPQEVDHGAASSCRRAGQP